MGGFSRSRLSRDESRSFGEKAVPGVPARAEGLFEKKKENFFRIGLATFFFFLIDLVPEIELGLRRNRSAAQFHEKK